MNLFKWAEKKIQKMSIWDFSLTKIVLILVGMIIGAYVAGFVKTNILYIAVLTVVLYAVLAYRVLKN